MFLTQIVNGQVSELALCEACARAKGLFDPQSLTFAEKFFPEATTLLDKDKEPIFGFSCGTAGSITKHGIVFDSTSPEGKLATTMLGEGNTVAAPNQMERARSLTEQYGKTILLANRLEEQIEKALAAHQEEIATASESVEIVG